MMQKIACILFTCFFSWLYLSNGRAIGIVVIRLLISLSVDPSVTDIPWSQGKTFCTNT